jgi:hypothetical protein
MYRRGIKGQSLLPKEGVYGVSNVLKLFALKGVEDDVGVVDKLMEGSVPSL